MDLSSDPEVLIKLEPNDGDFICADIRAWKCSKTVMDLVEDAGSDNPVPLVNISTRVLKKVCEFCDLQLENVGLVKANTEISSSSNTTTTTPFNVSVQSEPIKPWENTYLKSFGDDKVLIFQVILAANYLDISNLLMLCCRHVAGMFKGKSVDEIRKEFNIKNDFTPEEEAQIRKENEWLNEN